MINKFYHFNTRAVFDTQMPTPTDKSHDFYNKTIFIKDTQEIYTHGQFYDCSKYDDSQLNEFINDLNQKYDELEVGKADAIHTHSYEDLLSGDNPNKVLVSSENSFVLKDINELIGVTNTSKQLKFYCIEPVTITVNGVDTTYESNHFVNLFFKDGDEFTITTTSNASILTLDAWPGYLGYFYDWLEGVNTFSNIIFDMNDEAMYTKWSQGNQGVYHVQFAQYKNCVFWSDNTYVSDATRRTNYTLYYSYELPLCYSTIPDNTFKAFYFAYNVTSDPNWSNQAYKDSFAKATWATQVFSYYGLHSIGLFDMDSSEWNITLPKDCRGLMFYAPNILNAGVFDAVNCTNFGAKSGSWRDAFAYCYQLQNLYIKNLKVNLNVSWSPINQQSLEFILSNAINTSKITISLSPHTYYRLTDSNKSLAAEKNITLELITTNTTDDSRFEESIKKISQTLTDEEKDVVHDNIDLSWVEY